MRIAIVVAATDDGVIGKGNTMPWRLPDDLKHFKAVTMGKPVVMGRRTYESIGKPLPGRLNIVISRKAAIETAGFVATTSIDEALRAAGTAAEICIIGGGEVYRQILPRTDTIFLTRVHAKVDGDVYFPSLLESEWRETKREEHAADEQHAHPFSFLTLERKQ